MRNFNKEKYYTLTTRPIEDEKARYDFDSHIYILKPDYFEEKTGINVEEELGDSVLEANFFEETAEAFYEILYSYLNPTDRSNNRKVREYELANNNDLRHDIIRCLTLYARACITTDIDTVGDEHGIDFNKGTKIELLEVDSIPHSLIRRMRLSGFTNSAYYTYTINPTEYRVDY